jgi:reactive intermediate/imine deaminase
MAKQYISTPLAPQAIGTYSQAVKTGDTVYISGQIPLIPTTMELIDADIEAQTRQIFRNLNAIAEAAGGSLADFVKVNVFLTDLAHFPIINKVMADVFTEPYPARAAVEVSKLPKDAEVEVDAIMALDQA